MAYTADFQAAMDAATDDFGRFGHIGDTEMTESGEMRVVGISRTDTVALCNLAVDEFGPDLMAGGDKMTAALHGVMEMCLAIGVRLERARWDNVKK
jgi:hypothetical protein